MKKMILAVAFVAGGNSCYAQGPEVNMFVYCSTWYLGSPAVLYRTPIYQVRGYEYSDWRFREFSAYHEALFNRYVSTKNPAPGYGNCGFNENRDWLEKVKADQTKNVAGPLSIQEVDYDRPKWIPPTKQGNNRTAQ